MEAYLDVPTILVPWPQEPIQIFPFIYIKHQQDIIHIIFCINN